MNVLMKKIILIAAGLALITVAAAAIYFYFTDPGRLTTSPEFTGLEKSVSASTLTSRADPAINMTFDEDYEYIGGQTFGLYGTADVEQHFFVEKRPDGSLKSFFWLQFEGFLPSNDYVYDYTDSPLRVEMDGFNFYTDTAAGIDVRFWQLGSPGTDGYLVRKFLADKGYSYPDEYFYARLVHIPDLTRRKELLIIFIDDLKPSGFAAAELREGGEHEESWSEVEAAHLEKIRNVMTLSQLE